MGFFSPFKGRLLPADDMASIGSADKQINDIRTRTLTASGAVTVSGALTASGGVTGNVTGTVTGSANKLPAVELAAATQLLTAAKSGYVFIAAVDAAFTLPAAATAGAGVYYTFVTGVASAGAGVTIILNAADTADFKASEGGAAIHKAAAGTITNTPGTDVKGDLLTLVSDGVNNWTMINQSGTWA